MANYQSILKGEWFVAASMVIVSICQIQKPHVEVRDCEDDLKSSFQLVTVLPKKFDESYYLAFKDRKAKCSNMSVTGFRNCYIGVYYYFFLLSF